MIWGRPVHDKLTSTAEWGAAGAKSSGREASLRDFFQARIVGVKLRAYKATTDPDGIDRKLESALVDHLQGGTAFRLPRNFDPASTIASLRDKRAGGGVLSAAVAVAWLAGRDAEKVRKAVAAMPPSSDHGRLVEALYLAGDEANAAWSAPDVRAGWALQLVGSLFEFPALLALGMRHCHDAGLDLVKTVRAHLDALDDDLFTKSGDARVEVGDLGVALVRRPRPALEITQVVKGTGGRISAGLPMVLEEAVWGWVPFALKLMSGVMPLKTVRLGPGSIANVPALRSKPPRAKLLATLKESGSDIAIRVRLKGKLAIAEGDLAAYRARLAAGMEWIRGNHPAIKATPRLVIE